MNSEITIFSGQIKLKLMTQYNVQSPKAQQTVYSAHKTWEFIVGILITVLSITQPSTTKTVLVTGILKDQQDYLFFEIFAAAAKLHGRVSNSRPLSKHQL